ncbi:MAG: hypothetical protein ACI35O_03940 [Bacillaceae bacterium]
MNKLTWMQKLMLADNGKLDYNELLDFNAFVQDQKEKGITDPDTIHMNLVFEMSMRDAMGK